MMYALYNSLLTVHFTVSISHCNKLGLDNTIAQEEMSNPHYIKTAFADINPATEHDTDENLSNSCIPNNKQHQNEAQSPNTVSTQEDHNQSPEYAVVNKANKSFKTANSVQPTIGDEWYSPGYAEVGEVSNKAAATIKENQDTSAHESLSLKKSPSPVYAEVSEERKKKKQPYENHSVVEERERSPSPRYTQVDNVNKHSKDTVNQEKQEDEQHYYYSLEIPEELMCTGSTITESVYTSKNSQESQMVLTESKLCATTNANRQTEPATVNEVNTSPGSHGEAD